jgi:hypothetical protein
MILPCSCMLLWRVEARKFVPTAKPAPVDRCSHIGYGNEKIVPSGKHHRPKIVFSALLPTS